MNMYFHGAIQQQLERGRLLFTRIPNKLPREFHLLAQPCADQLSSVLDQLQALLEDPRMELPEYQPLRLRKFRRLVEDMNFLETVGVAALERYNKNDQALNQLIELIRNEISYPLLPPVVISLSQQYFYIHPRLNLMCVPLAEGDFLLHLPDLYHELAHPLANPKHDRRVKPYQDALSKSISLALQYIEEEKQKEERRRGPEELCFYLSLWEKSWWKWIIELFCDLFAVYTIGPAFAWAHYHLCAQMGGNPFLVPTFTTLSHPPDDARMRTMLYGLELTGFSSVASIKNHWDNLMQTAGAKPEPEYRRCVSDQVLKATAQNALSGVSALGCRIAKPETKDLVYTTLNEAWTVFWRDPRGYTEWERKAITTLRAKSDVSHPDPKL